MKKAELVAKVVEKTSLSKKDASVAIDAIFDEISAAMIRGEQVSLVGFGTFGSKERKARTCVNPLKPGEKIEVPAMKVPSFKPGKPLKESLKQS
jgi:DNA-binding protein HU-beta